jgi:hypothetical protein
MKGSTESDVNTDLLKKLLMLELFKLGVPQQQIGKKLKMNIVVVNAFLKGIQRSGGGHAKD